ncbi:MAG: Cys-tRNA(Pro) deacylase [Ignavibacteriaceae bacterium]|nr:Cys-tRNA(Pro) deacylase [Ignavibacteriaceae bacterium]
MNKTNAMRILDANKIEYSAHEYEVDESDLSGETVAKKINAAEDEIFKTLVARGDKTGILVFCIPVSAELNLKNAAAASGNKKVELIKLNELLSLTGYIRGGCSPIGMKKEYPVFIEETAQMFDKIFISAGIRGVQSKLAPSDIQKITTAQFAGLI